MVPKPGPNNICFEITLWLRKERTEMSIGKIEAHFLDIGRTHAPRSESVALACTRGFESSSHVPFLGIEGQPGLLANLFIEHGSKNVRMILLPHHCSVRGTEERLR